MKIYKKQSSLADLGTAIGVGLLAGLAGTVAMTVSQIIEAQITKREKSDTPVKAVSKVLDVKPTSEEEKSKVNEEIHFTYGTSWGVARGLIGLMGLKGFPAAFLHFAAVWGTSLIMLPSLKVAPPVTEEKPKDISVDVLHHGVYAVVSGLVYDAITRKKKNPLKRLLH
ncbi:hypothetical protein GS399_07020 [Pedobacter sp. HMF7647]|uniref:DUF1440 domain-containing protein n=1 Tax=Hufsiella arboris TaxID=2695275 RepID=A0A7K1Y8M1_9SPHI|nr:hypothetical protein [Hufsiella arboris]MXV50721.1 hypothetical protein [Hufsiella arboris]